MSAATIAAYVVAGVIGVVVFRLTKSPAKPDAEAFLWLIGIGLLIGTAIGLMLVGAR